MSVSRASFVFVLLAGFAATPTLAQQRKYHGGMPSRLSLNRNNLELAWWAQATLDPQRDRVSHLTLDEEFTYVQSTAGTVTAINNLTGQRAWAVQFGRRDLPSFPVITNDDLVLVPVGRWLYAAKKRSGDLAWKIRMPHQPSVSPTIDSDRVFIGSERGTVIAFTLDSIQEMYERNAGPQWTDYAADWRYKAGKRIITPPISDGNVVTFASQNKSVYAVEVGDHALRFQLETNDSVSAPFGYSEGLLYVATDGYKVYCVEMQSGQLAWTFSSGTAVLQEPRIIGGQVFLCPKSGGMFCLSKYAGDRQWWTPHATGFIAASSDKIYASDARGEIIVLSRSDGTVLSAIPLLDYSIRISNDRTGRIMVANPTGRVLCLHEIGRDIPFYHRYPERQPILPQFAPEEPEAESNENGAEPAAPGDDAGAPEQN